MKITFRYFFCSIILLFTCQAAPAQNQLKKQIGDTLNVIANNEVWVGNVQVRNIAVNKRKKTITITVNESLGYLPFREENVSRIYSAVKSVLPAEYSRYKINCQVGRNNIEDLIPNYYRNRGVDAKRQFKKQEKTTPLVTNMSRPYHIPRGLQDRHIAVWQSHGWYYNQQQARWNWQRARLFQTVEDLYTQSYVLPFLVPMLENAGANVLLPRERDTQLNEVIVDNDNLSLPSVYLESNSSGFWQMGQGAGFAHTKPVYVQGENPFTLGTFRQCETTHDKNRLSTAEWIPDIPEAGRYAVYVSYKSLPNSTQKARYAVHHKGGITQFEVNQTMYGGTWLYLGHFDFDQGSSARGRVVLDNYSPEREKVVTADAVKFGGGMGNIARQPSLPDTIRVYTDVKSKRTNGKAYKDSIAAVPSPFYTPEISSYPRFTEGARYWLQWAGMPDSIYSRSKGLNDYTDDFQSRGFWVNYISGGSSVSQKDEGLKVPVDMALGFHTDAGTTANDSIIGTLGICTTRSTDKRYEYKNGVSRLAARDLADLIQTQVVSDIRMLYEPGWVRRGLWDKSYSEAREPEVPTMLLELLSHQNFADMRYGLDPRFRFHVSRSIYKGILKYFESVYGGRCIVQPLPVEQFNIRFTGGNEIELHWEPAADPLEPAAVAKQYVVYMQVDDSGFDNGFLLENNRCRFKMEPDRVYSFKVTAVNEGGESFPSEVLSAGRASQNRGEVLIVNGFDRVGAPMSFMQDTVSAGFLNDVDAGIPYMSDISFTGKQYEFLRSVPWVHDDEPGFGASYADYETQVVAGNTFNYPFIHGKAIIVAGYSFISCSRKALENNLVNLNDYKLVDLILGRQKETFAGNGKSAPEFKTFPLDLQHKITEYADNGGNLFVTGSYAASDMYHNRDSTGNDRAFVENVLGYKLRMTKACIRGKVKTVQSPLQAFERSEFTYYDAPNPLSYYVQSPDAIEPVDSRGYTICRYAESNMSAGTAYDTGRNKICALGFPFETIKEESERNKLMQSVLMFLQEGNTP